MNTRENQSKTPRGDAYFLYVFLISVLILAFWIWALNWIFTKYTGNDYLTWYINYGAQISIAASFLALIWEDLEEESAGLLSVHPAEFLASCLALCSIFYFMLTTHLTKEAKKDGEDFVSKIERGWDSWMRRCMVIVLGTAVFGWVLVASPLTYLLTLISGAPARQERRGTMPRLIVNPEAKRHFFGTTLRYLQPTESVPDGFVVVSLGKRPFALISALNAAILFLMEVYLFPG